MLHDPDAKMLDFTFLIRRICGNIYDDIRFLSDYINASMKYPSPLTQSEVKKISIDEIKLIEEKLKFLKGFIKKGPLILENGRE